MLIWIHFFKTSVFSQTKERISSFLSGMVGFALILIVGRIRSPFIYIPDGFFSGFAGKNLVSVLDLKLAALFYLHTTTAAGTGWMFLFLFFLVGKSSCRKSLQRLLELEGLEAVRKGPDSGQQITSSLLTVFIS